MFPIPPRGGRRVLVVEDEALIGLALADVLEEAGYACMGPFQRGADALSWLDGGSPDLGLLDITLRDGSCEEVAQRLRRSGVPFLIYSGRNRRDIPISLAGAPRLEKPASYAELLGALDGLAGIHPMLDAWSFADHSAGSPTDNSAAMGLASETRPVNAASL